MKKYDTTSLDWEEWRDIPGYEWYYMVSSMGRVKSLGRYAKRGYDMSDRIVREKIISYGKSTWYACYKLSINWDRKTLKGHRLVASAFLWLEINSFVDQKLSLCVCHKDDDPFNNRVDNLFLGTKSENNKDRDMKWRNRFNYWPSHHNYWKPSKNTTHFWKKWKENHMYGMVWSLHHWSKPVLQLSLDWLLIREWSCASEAQRYFANNNSTAISQCCRWITNSSFWYKWILKNI